MDNIIIEKIKSYNNKQIDNFTIVIFYNESFLYNIYFENFQHFENFVRELNKKIIESEDCYDIKDKLFEKKQSKNNSYIGSYKDYLEIPYTYDILQFMFDYFNYMYLN